MVCQCATVSPEKQSADYKFRHIPFISVALSKPQRQIFQPLFREEINVSISPEFEWSSKVCASRIFFRSDILAAFSL